MTTPEGEIKLKIKDVLDELGAYWFMPVPTGYGKRTLDFLCCHRGYFFAIEAKRPGKEETKFQAITAGEMRAAGGTVFLVNDDTSLAYMRDTLLSYCAAGGFYAP